MAADADWHHDLNGHTLKTRLSLAAKEIDEDDTKPKVTNLGGAEVTADHQQKAPPSIVRAGQTG